MAGAKGIRAGRAFVELFADDTALARGLRRAQKRLQAFGEGARTLGTRIAASGAAILAGFGAAVGVFISAGDALDKMSGRTGISVEALSELGYAAAQSGANLETLEKGVRTMQKAIVEAAGGTKTYVDALADLGLTAKDLQGLSPEEQFTVIADRISKIEDPTRRAAIAMQVLGRAGTALLPLMSGGAQGIEELREAARDLGLTVSTETATNAARLGDRIDDLKSVVRATAIAVGDALAPTLEKVVVSITRVAVAVQRWIKGNQALVLTAAKAAVAVVVIGGAIFGVGLAAAIASVAIGGLIGIISAVGAVLGGVLAVLGAILSPIGLLVAAILGATVAFFRFTAVGQAAIDWLGERFAELSDIATRAFGGIRDALLAGDISLAAQVLWAGLKVLWLDGTKEIRDTWSGGVVLMRRIFSSVVSGMQAVWTRFGAGVRSAWEATQNWLAKRFTELQGVFDSSLDVEGVKRGLDELSASNLARIAKQADDALTALDKQQAAKEQEILGDAVDRLDERRKALEDAKKELDEVVEQARRRREEGDATRADRPSLRDRFGDLLDFDGIAAAVQKVSVQGTFNAAAVGGLAGSSPAQERAAKAAEETARNTRRLVERSNTGGLTFT